MRNSQLQIPNITRNTCIAEPPKAWGGGPLNVRDGVSERNRVNCVTGEGGFQ